MELSNGLLTVHLDTIKVLFANLMHNFFIKSIVSSTCFEHYCAHHQENLIVYMHHLVPDIVILLIDRSVHKLTCVLNGLLRRVTISGNR